MTNVDRLIKKTLREFLIEIDAQEAKEITLSIETAYDKGYREGYDKGLEDGFQAAI